MFVGAVPKPAIEQITRVVPFADWRELFVGCSGSFRFDMAVKQRHWSVKVHSNDVSLLSCGIGRLAMGEAFNIGFSGRLAFIEDRVAPDDFAGRVAAVMVALTMAAYKGDNRHARAHFDHYAANFADYLGPARDKLAELVKRLNIESFQAGDFQDQVDRAREAGGGIAAFPPTYKGGYERLYKFVEENTDWPRPDYEMWDPAGVEEWTEKLAANGVRYCIVSDRRFANLEPVTVYRATANKPVYAYADQGGASVRFKRPRRAAFRYELVDPARITAASTVRLAHATAQQMNYLKDRFLAKGIVHSAGVLNFLVFVDDRLAGGFIYNQERFPGSNGTDALYLLSDFATVPARRLSKLIAMLATSRETVALAEARLGYRFASVKTTAFTDKPVSMKYRGIFKLVNRKPGMLNYGSAVREKAPQEIFAEWFQKHAQAEDQDRRAA